MSRFFCGRLPRLALGAVVVFLGVQSDTGATQKSKARTKAPDWTMALRPVADGGYVFEAGVDRLRVTKHTKSAGATMIRITDGSDAIKVDVDPKTITVAARGRSVTITMAEATHTSIGALKRLIDDSAVARAFHTAVLRELDRVPQRTLHTQLMITDALLRSLAGDESTINRFRKVLVGPPSPTISSVKFGQSCYSTWEAEVMRAYDELWNCHNELTGIRGVLWQLCNFRFFLWVDSAWFSFLACSALPLR
ncbi:MAG: hypothetical protein HY654_12600 [Acidobacteria bacterium]|nr:hypothetical protein [Acidobacteriota bacterium]